MKWSVVFALAVLSTSSGASENFPSLTVSLNRRNLSTDPNFSKSVSLGEAVYTRLQLLKAVGTGESTTVALTNQAVFYSSSVNIGNPPTVYSLLVDTGSSNTFCGFDKEYVRTSTSIATGEYLNVTYGSGNVTGVEYLDQVSVAPGLTITNQSIGDVTSSNGLSGIDADGILGLGPIDLTNGTLSPNNKWIPTIIDNLVSQNLIKHKMFGVYFAPATSISETNGALTYGGVDKSFFKGEIVYTPLTTTYPSSYYWGINVTSCTYGNRTIISDSTAGIVDSGTTQVLLADDFFDVYMQAIPGSSLNSTIGILEIPPSSISYMHRLKFLVGDKEVVLDDHAQLIPQTLNIYLGGDPLKRYGVVGPLGNNSGTGLDFILGMTFMERHYTVFDADNSRVGFAQTKHTFA